MAQPNITYITPTPGESIRASYKEGHNNITVKYISDISLNFYQVRITKDGEKFGLDTGVLAYQYAGSLAANVEHSFNIEINDELFPEDGIYRIGLYAREALENTWDVTYLLFITSEGEIFIPSNADGFEVISKDED